LPGQVVLICSIIGAKAAASESEVLEGERPGINMTPEYPP
jgi:hypothetical protein